MDKFRGTIYYNDLVEYTKENHVNWNTELFSVLRGFFDWYLTKQNDVTYLSQDMLPSDTTFTHPQDGEYSIQDVMDLFNT